jgi:hypothetical protein
MSTAIKLILPALHSGQQRMIDQAKRFNVAVMGRRFGKTTLGINRAIVAALEGQPAAWFAPTYKQLAEVWRELVSLLRPVTKAVNQQEKQVRLIGPTGRRPRAKVQARGHRRGGHHPPP